MNFRGDVINKLDFVFISRFSTTPRLFQRFTILSGFPFKLVLFEYAVVLF
jgi:hypothetical protein